VDLTGSILDRRYRITGLLGKGGMGHVYEAVHIALDQRVAVKVLHPRYAHEERFRERFLQEARAASKIRHPNVVEIKDFGETPDGSVYFVMEYLHGHDVGAELKRHGTLPWPRTRHVLLQAASALHAAHVKHIIHRDIKPGNCFLIEDEAEGLHDLVKVLDFGIAKVGSDSHADAQGKGLTGTGEVFGTASYMSPEQARGEVLDARSDMYSLGIMAYEMLVGQVPFSGVNAIHVITQHLTAKPESLRSRDSTIAPAVEALVLKMIAKERHDRFASMAEVEQALRELPEDLAARRTRLWSSPGDLRALVAEKKAAGAMAQAPMPAAKGPGPAVPSVGAAAGAAMEMDPDRTETVSPSEAVKPGTPRRTFVSADRPSAGAGTTAKPAAPGGTAVVPGRPAAAPVLGKSAAVPGSAAAPARRPMTPAPGSGAAAPGGTVVVPGRLATPMPGAAVPPVPASSATPVPGAPMAETGGSSSRRTVSIVSTNRR